jgi:CheY-like chemotaxis protein
MTKKILIAEDDADIRFILDMILNDAGYNVEPLSEGTSIVTREKDWPDLFILDKEMPVIDGLALCKYLKLKDETKDIPVIMISAYHKLKKKAKEAGVDDFIEKPFELKDLLRTIDKYIHLPDQQSRLA